MTDQIITDEGGDLRRWRTELPNIIDDLGLDVFERALYGHYKRVCGANGGECYESTRTTADKIPGMSAAQVSIVRRRLADKGLVIEEVQHTVHIKIVDIWELNFAYYSVQDRPSIKGWTIPQLREWVNTSVYHLNTPGGDCLPGKQGVYEVNSDAKKCLPGKTKKEPIKNKPSKKKEGATPARDYLTDVFTGNVNMREGEKIIQRADWDIRSQEHRQAMAAFLEASRLPVPRDKMRRDWLNSVDIHVKTYGASQLEELYPCIIAQMRGDGLTVSRPGSVTNNLAAWWAENRNGGKHANSKQQGVSRRVPGYSIADPAGYHDQLPDDEDAQRAG